MYNIYLEGSAEKDLKRLPSDVIKAVVKNIKQLSDNPRPANCKKLKGLKNFWRIRVGNYRIVYEIIDSSRRINVYRIKHRKDIYR